MDTIDTVIIGAGAAGLFAGGILAKAGTRVCVIDHAKKPAEKVRISGGGRCNFTNLHTRADAFLSDNPHFAKSALARYTPLDFCELMAENGLSWHEKTLGQLFCDQRAGAVIQMLLDELQNHGGDLRLDTSVAAVSEKNGQFDIQTPGQHMSARSLIIATGGLSIPKMGATGFAYDVARQFGHEIVTPRPALVPFTVSGALKEMFSSLSGVSTQARVSTGGTGFTEALLFTHRGLSGPAVLQASSYWREGMPVTLTLLPSENLLTMLKTHKSTMPKRSLSAVLNIFLPDRLTDMLASRFALPHSERIGALSDKILQEIAARLTGWTFIPTGTEGWRTAEVTAGGVSTAALSSQTMESSLQDGLYFIGECVDVTGWLGGYNFQWAWASGHAAAEAILCKERERKHASDL